MSQSLKLIKLCYQCTLEKRVNEYCGLCETCDSCCACMECYECKVMFIGGDICYRCFRC